MALSNFAVISGGGVPPSGLYADVVSVDLDNSYPAGGYAFSSAIKSALGLGASKAFVLVRQMGACGGYVLRWDRANGKLKVYQSGDQEAAGSVTGTAVEPFDLANGDTLVGSVDGEANQTVTLSATAAALENDAGDIKGETSVLGTAVEPFALAHGDTLVGSVDGAGDQTATISATAAALECANAEVYALVNGQTLTVKIDDELVAQTITFLAGDFVDIGNATAEEVAAVIDANIVGADAAATSAGTKVTITSQKKGTDSGVEVTGGDANVALGFDTNPVDGTGNVADVSAVTVAEIKTIVEAAWTNGGGAVVTNVGGAVKIATATLDNTASIQVVAASTADDELGLDNLVHHRTYALVDAMTLLVKIDGESVAQTVAFASGDFVDISRATATEIAAKIDSSLTGADAAASDTNDIKVTITSQSKGTGSHVQVTGGTANAVLGFDTVATDGTGNVANVDAVTIAELKTLIEATWTNGDGVVVTDDGNGHLKISTVGTGPDNSVQVIAASTGDDEIGLDNDPHLGTEATPGPLVEVTAGTNLSAITGCELLILSV